MIQAEIHLYKVSEANLSVWPLRLIPVQYMLAEQRIDFPNLGVVFEEFRMPTEDAEVTTPCRSCLRLRRARIQAFIQRFRNQRF